MTGLSDGNGMIEGLVQVNGLMQERRNSVARALELRISYTNQSKYESRQWDVDIAKGNNLLKYTEK